MVKDIVIFYYLPISMFVSLFYCVLLIGVIFAIRQHKGLISVLLYCIVLTFLWIIYIYPISIYIHAQEYILNILVILISIYNLITIVTTQRKDHTRPLYGSLFPLIGKSAVIVFGIIVLTKNTYHNTILMITSIDAILSSGIVFVKPLNISHFRIQIPQRELFMVMILITIVYCITVIYTTGMEVLLLNIFVMISVCNIVVFSKILLYVCSERTDNNVYGEEEHLYNNGKYDSLIKMIKEHVNEHYSSPIDKYTIALQCEMHPDYISKVFKNEEGITINKFIQSVRMEKAIRLIQDTDKKIIEVAFDVGYENLATFYRHFIQQHKKSPQQLRKEKYLC